MKTNFVQDRVIATCESCKCWTINVQFHFDHAMFLLMLTALESPDL